MNVDYNLYNVMLDYCKYTSLHVIRDNSKTIPCRFIIYDNNELHICSFMQKHHVIYTHRVYIA